MQLTDTIPIVFNGGSYGTYLEWVLTALTSDESIDPPFTDSGSSHLFLGNHLGGVPGWRQYASGTHFHQFVRLHPKNHKEESLSANLNQIINQVSKMLYLYPDHDSVLMNINNWLGKVRKDWWEYEVEKEISLEKIHKNWPECKGMAVDQIPLWIRRELLSFYLIPAWHDQIEWYHPERWHNPNCYLVLINELLYNFESTINHIQQFCGLTFKRPIAEILPYHKIMLAAQLYSEQDQLCHQIITSTIDRYEFTWKSLPLPSQVWVQWQLRNLGWEIHCDGLDMFPTNSVQLANLLYKP
jgi:hypothetical protein